MSLNKVMLLGNIASDITAKDFNSNKCVSFRMAMSEKFTDRAGQPQEKTEFIGVTAWRKTAEVIEKFCAKGTQIFIEGKLQTREYEKNGEKRYVTEVLADNVQLLGKKDKDALQGIPSRPAGQQGYQQPAGYPAQQPAYQQSQAPYPPYQAPANDSDLPF